MGKYLEPGDVIAYHDEGVYEAYIVVALIGSQSWSGSSLKTHPIFSDNVLLAVWNERRNDFNISWGERNLATWTREKSYTIL